MSYLTQPTQDQSLNGIISLTDGSGLVIENGQISGLTNLDIGDNISCKTLSTGNIYGQNGNLNIGNSSSNVIINGSNIILTGPTVYVQSQTTQVLDQNIELNYGGNATTAVGSGISVLGNLNVPVARFQTDANLNWTLTSPNNKLTLGTLQGNAVSVETVYGNTQISTPYLLCTTANINTTNIVNDNVTNLTCQSGNISTLSSTNGTISTLTSTNANITTQTSSSITSGYMYGGLLNVSNTGNIFQLNVTGTTDASNISTGSSTNKGGTSITKSLYVGGNINGLSNINISQNAIITGDTTTNNLVVNNNANIVGNLNISGNTITNNTSTSTNIVGSNGNISNITASKIYTRNQTVYTGSFGHINSGSIQSKDIRGYNVNAINGNIDTMISNVSTINNLFGTTASMTNGSFNNLSTTTFGSFSLIPPGTIQMTVINGVLPPTGWFYCRGQAVDRVIYATLFNAIGTTFGPGDGVTTFNVPNFQGCFLRGLTVTDSTISGYTTLGIGAYQFDTTRSHTHTFGYGTATDGYASGTRTDVNTITSGGTRVTTTDLTDNRTYGGGTETAPYHSIVNYLIKF